MTGIRGRRAGLAAAAVAATSLAITACGNDGGESAGGDDVVAGDVEFEPNAAFLTAASERSSSEPHRIEMSMRMRVVGDGVGEVVDLDAPVMTGEEDGAAFEAHMDMGEWMEAIAESEPTASPLPDIDFTMDMVSDGETMFVRAPMFAAIAEEAPAGTDLGPFAELATLGDGWGRVDVASLAPDALADLQSAAGGPAGADPRVLLDLVAGADDVEELGTEEVDGVAVNGLEAGLTLGEMLEAQGTDPVAFAEQTLGDSTATGLDTEGFAFQLFLDSYLDTEMPFAVWVDGDGYVRRVSYDMDVAAMLGDLEFEGESMNDAGIEEMTMGATVDFSDFGDPGIAIDMPDAPSAVDVTEAFGRLNGGG